VNWEEEVLRRLFGEDEDGFGVQDLGVLYERGAVKRWGLGAGLLRDHGEGHV
jgi:hypothetical protein